MPKEEWGVKRICPTTGKRFYDLNKSRSMAPDAEDAETKKLKAGSILDEDADLLDDDDVDVELDDDLLEDDEDEDVSLDDIADVASDDNDL